MKFDICLMNPPYATSNDNEHLKFVDKLLDIAKTQIVVMPTSFIRKHNVEKLDHYKDKFSKYLISIEEYSSRLFTGTSFGHVGVYVFGHKEEYEPIYIKYIDNKEDNVDNLLNISIFSEYEKNILKHLNINGSQKLIYGPRHTKRKYLLNDINDKESYIVNEVIKDAEKRKISKNAIYLICNSVNGGMNGTFFSNKVGQILLSYDELIKYYASIDVGNPHHILLFNSKKAAENCKSAMKRPLLRFTCYKIQDYQRMLPRCYEYIPNIDWEDDRVLTDECLLEVCGCPKDKAKEYAEYCKKYIEENVDNK